MAEPPTVNEESTTISKKQDERTYETYKQIKEYEHHFNGIQTEIRKLASVWLLATLAAIAFLVKGFYLGGVSDLLNTQNNAKILISLVGFMGTLGILLLFVLDQMVYHRLLNAVFLLGLRMEYLHSFLPPIRTLMMLFSRKRGVGWHMRFYYIVPMFIFAFIALFAGLFNVYEDGIKMEVNTASVIIGLFTLSIPVWAFWEPEGKELYEDITRDFGDDGFNKFMKSLFEVIEDNKKFENDMKYQEILKKWE